MDIVIAGAHGQVARRLTRLLAARGDTVDGLVRDRRTPGTWRTTARDRSCSTSNAPASTRSPTR